MDRDFVSVVLLNQNGLEYLKKTIPSIMKFNYPRFEVVVVDNGSTDGSLEFLAKFKKIRVIKNPENLGYGKGKNQGVAHAKGKYIFLLDNDILIEDRQILVKLIKFYNNLEKPAFVTVLMKNEGDRKWGYLGGYYSVYGLKKYEGVLDPQDIPKYHKIGCPHGADMFIEKSIWNKIGGFDESQPFNLDDTDVGARSIIMGYNNYLFSASSLIHLGKANRINTKMWNWKFKYYFIGFSKVMLKNYRLSNLLWRYPIMIGFCTLKTFKQAVFRLNPGPVISFVFSCGSLIAEIPSILKNRSEVQSRRVIKRDTFLMIRPPKV